MTTILLDDALRQKLNGLKAEIELRDETDKAVGHVLPAEKYQNLLDSWAKNRSSDAVKNRAAAAWPRSSLIYEVIPDDCMVRALDVWTVR